MALDTSIYGNLQPVAPPINPLAQMAQVAQLQHFQSQTGKLQRDEERQNRLYGVLQSAEFQQGDAATRQRLAYGAGDVAAAASIGTAAAQMNKDTREAEKSQIQTAKEHYNVVGQIIGSAKDQPSYERAISMLTERGIKVPNAPPQYDPNVVQQFAEATRTEQERVLAQIQQQGQAITVRGQDLGAETSRRGQDIGASTAAAGQAVTTRGQDLTDARQREANATGRAPSGYRFGADGTTLEAIPGGPSDPAVMKPSEALSKEIMAINQQRSTINGALQAIETAPDAFSLKRGAVAKLPYGETLAGRTETPEQTQARAYVFNNASAVIKERAGTAQSAQELSRINSFLPADTDNATQIKNKLKGYQTYLDDLEAGTRGKPTQPPGGTTPPTTPKASKAGAQRTVVKTGTKPNGQRVTVYSDGSVDVN